MRPRLLLLAAIAAATAMPRPARCNEVVILKTGNRLEVERAFATGDTYHLKLVGGGSVIVPASVVKRISNSAADLPQKETLLIASTGAWTPSARTEPEDVPDAFPPEVVREPPGRFEGSDSLPKVDPRALVPGAPTGVNGATGIGRPSLADQSKARPVSPSPLGGGSFRRAGGGIGGGLTPMTPNPAGGGGAFGDPGRGSSLPRVGGR